MVWTHWMWIWCWMGRVFCEDSGRWK